MAALAIGMLSVPALPLAASAQDPVTITMSSWQWTEPGRGPAMWSHVERFMELNPDIIVEQVTIPFPEYEQTLSTRAAAGDPPDVMILVDTLFYPLADNGFLHPLPADLTTPEGLLPANDTGRWNDTQYGYLWEGVPYGVFYYNTEMLANAGLEVPTDFESFTAAAKALTDGSGQYGFGYRHLLAEASGWWGDLSNWVYGFGGRWSLPDGTPTINDPKVVEGVTAFASFYQQDIVPKGADSINYRRMFWLEELGMLVDNSAVSTIIVSENPDMRSKLGAGVAPFPEPTTGRLQIYMAIAADSEHVEAGERLLAYLLEPEVQDALAISRGGSAGARDVTLPAEFVAENPWVETFGPTFAAGFAILPEGLELRTAEIRTVVLEEVSRVILEGADPQAALDTAQQRVEELLSR